MTHEQLFLLKIAKMKSNLGRRDLWGSCLTLDQHPTRHPHPLAGPWLLHRAGTAGRRLLRFSGQEVMEWSEVVGIWNNWASADRIL